MRQSVGQDAPPNAPLRARSDVLPSRALHPNPPRLTDALRRRPHRPPAARPGPAGRVRGHAPPPPRQPQIPPHPPVFPHDLVGLVPSRHRLPQRRKARGLPERLRRALHGRAVRGLVGGPDPGLRPSRLGPAIHRPASAVTAGRPDLPQRCHLLHPGLWRHRPPHHARPLRRDRRGWHRPGLHRRLHRLPSGPVSILLPPRSPRHPAGWPRRPAAWPA